MHKTCKCMHPFALACNQHSVDKAREFLGPGGNQRPGPDTS